MRKALLASLLSFAIAGTALADVTLVAPNITIGQNETKSFSITVIPDAETPLLYGMDLNLIVSRLGQSIFPTFGDPFPLGTGLATGSGMVFGGDTAPYYPPGHPLEENSKMTKFGFGTSEVNIGFTVNGTAAPPYLYPMSNGQILATMTISGNGAALGDYTLSPNGTYGTFLYDTTLDGSVIPLHFTPGTITVTPAPEPAMIAQLLGLGGAVGFFYLRRRRSARKKKLAR